jgi:hypothetical protein
MYTVSAGYANKPAVDVSWYDAIRFVNWLGNGQGNGDTETGTYTITNPTYYPGLGFTEWAVTVPSLSQRAAWAAGNQVHWVLPTEDEWYKAAYYKGGGTNAGYWAYPTQSNTTPTSEAPPGGSNSANIFNQYTGYALTHSLIRDPTHLYLTDVGAYSNSPSAYGTFDQGGDVGQWNEAFISPPPPEGTLTGNDRGLRGSDWSSGITASNDRGWNDADEQDAATGFRVGSVGEVPEPRTTELLLAGTIAGLVISLIRLSLVPPRAQRGAGQENEKLLASPAVRDNLLNLVSTLRGWLLQHRRNKGVRNEWHCHERNIFDGKRKGTRGVTGPGRLVRCERNIGCG